MGNLDALLKSGLPVAWNAIWIGYQAGAVTVDELQAYACDLLGILPGDMGYLVFRLFDADPTNQSEIRSLLEQLASGERTGVEETKEAARERAERTWNVAAVLRWLDVERANRWRVKDVNIDYIYIDFQNKLPFPERPSAVPKVHIYLGCLEDYDAALLSLEAWVSDQVTSLRDTVANTDDTVSASPP